MVSTLINRRSMSLRRATSLVAATLFAVVFGQAQAATYDYTAVTKNKSANAQGPVQAGSLMWQCSGGISCRISGPWPVPGLGACRALAKIIGPIASYGHPGQYLSEGQIAQCNKGVVTSKGGSSSNASRAATESLSTRVSEVERANGSKQQTRTPQIVAPVSSLGSIKGATIESATRYAVPPLQDQLGYTRTHQIVISGEFFTRSDEGKLVVVTARPQSGPSSPVLAAVRLWSDDEIILHIDRNLHPWWEAVSARRDPVDVVIVSSQTGNPLSNAAPVGFGSVDADRDGILAIRWGGFDCDDTDARRYPGNPEVADSLGHDEDCDPETFGARDSDGDGAFDALATNIRPDGSISSGTDCDDQNRGIHPGASEVCDGLDNNCDGVVDEHMRMTAYLDEDGDGFGDRQKTVQVCPAEIRPGVVSNYSDCDDSDYDAPLRRRCE